MGMQGFLDIFDIYLLEAVINGILLGGVLALLALGLNLIFGVIDVTWICYAELVMIGMYAMYFMVQYYGLSYFVAAPFTILLVAMLGAALHFLVIEFAVLLEFRRDRRKNTIPHIATSPLPIALKTPMLRSAAATVLREPGGNGAEIGTAIPHPVSA